MEEKNYTMKRTSFKRTLCFRWVATNRPDIFSEVARIAEEKFPRIDGEKQSNQHADYIGLVAGLPK